MATGTVEECKPVIDRFLAALTTDFHYVEAIAQRASTVLSNRETRSLERSAA